jgi:mannosyltransferase
MQVDSRRRTLDDAVVGDALSHRLPGWAVALIGLTLAAAVALRFASGAHLWLDEALTVNIARLPLSDIPNALRHDGAPPMYYVLLHFWMLVFGEGDVAVRALAGVIGVATLPLAYFAGVRLGGGDRERGRWVGWALVLVVATSPFGIRYSVENRMYSLTIALVFLGYLAVTRALDRPTLGRLACVSGVVAALLYAHYWSFFLLAVVGGILVWSAVAGPASVRPAARRVIAAIVVGGVCFVPWLPILISQLRHTGTPWASPTVSPSIVVSTLSQFAGGRVVVGRLLLLVLTVVAGLAMFTRPRADDDARKRSLSAVRWVALVGGGTLLVGLALSFIAGSTYQTRYAAVVFPFVAMIAAFGLTVVRNIRVRTIALAIVVVLGLLGGRHAVQVERTQAGRVASAIIQGAHRGDLVAYCPDQIGPAVSRVVPRTLGVRQLAFPMTGNPQLIDWVDYKDKVGQANPEQFATRLLARAGPSTIWFVSSTGYLPFELKCERILAALTAARGPGRTLVQPDANIFEHMGVVRFDR